MNLQTVKKIMNKNPIVVHCQTPLMEIIKTLLTSHQTQLPVVNNDNKLIGMVSLVDCQKALLISGYHCDKPVTVNEIMAKTFTVLNENDDISNIAIKTQEQTENIFPIVNEGKLIGVLKRTDLIVHLQNNLSLCSS